MAHFSIRSDRESAVRRYKDRRAWLDAIKSRPCADCGGIFDPCVMDLDHVPSRGKKLYNGFKNNLYRSMAVIEAEVAKCDVVCANCHRLRTHRRGQYGNGRPPQEQRPLMLWE